MQLAAQDLEKVFFLGVDETGRAGGSADDDFVADFQSEYGRLPTMYASQGYDAARLIDGAVRQVGGNLQDKDALRKALEAADFKSIRGDFKYNTNHFPITDWYRVDVVKGKDGKAELSATGVVFKDHKDAYFEQCKM